MPRKRTFDEVEASEPPPEKKGPSLVQKLRNMWEFASTMQYIFLFGKVIKIDEDFDIEDFENECLKPGYSEKLEEIGLQLLRFVSSNRGLNLDNWDEYVRRQYHSKSPGKAHPYGEDDEPKRYRSFDIFTKIRVLHQLTSWTFANPDRIRGAFPDLRESDQLDWRMNVFGYDEDDREYFVLDDSRLYRRSEPPLPPAPKAKPKANSLKARAARRRASKRRKLEETESQTETHDEDEETSLVEAQDDEQMNSADKDTFGGFKWECIAITLDDYQEFISKLHTSAKNYPNEKQMRERLLDEVMPTIQELADKQRRKQERREKELMMMERMAGAKRSSRLADKQEKEKREHEEAEVARKRAADLAAAHREQERQLEMEQERHSRMMTREQRIRDREYKRILMEEQLAQDAEEQKKIEEGGKRGSERQIKERMEKNKKELEDLESEDEWTFDCSGCGMHGKNFDDGSHSIACEKCNVWQHSKCLGFSKATAEKDDFTFVCQECRKKERQEARRKEEEERRKEEEANKPKILLKFSPGQSSSPPQNPTKPLNPPTADLVQSVDVPRGPHSDAPAVNGHYNPASPVRPTSQQGQMYSQSNGLSQPYHRPQQSPSQSSSNGYARNPLMPAPYVNANSGAAVRADVQPSHQGTPYLNGQDRQSNTQQQQTSSTSDPTQFTPRHESTQNQHASTPANRIPSPILNKPTMSPTQGNPEVGPIAGFPKGSSSSYHPDLFTSRLNASRSPQTNGESHADSSGNHTQRVSQTPNPQYLSGLSPVKQRSPPPLPHPSSFSASFNSSMPNPTNAAQSPNHPSRSFSGTPIFPPAEKLAPSPEHLNREPVPTPSKQPTPGPTPNASFDMRASFSQQTPTHNGTTKAVSKQ